jgi:hypothetical protein
MARTAEQIQAELDIINGALQSLYSGTRIAEIRIRSDIVDNMKKFSEITIESLLVRKNLLEQELLALSNTVPTFRQYSSLPIIVNKQGVY